MEVKSLVLSNTLLCAPHVHSNINRDVCKLPATVNPRKWRVNTDSRSLRFCPKAVLKGNLEATRVPTSVPVRVAYELLQAGYHYLDVRTPEEFSAGHAVGAFNIPYMYKVGSGMTKNTKFLEEVSSRFGKFDEILAGCRTGKRSMMAATDLLTVGYTTVIDIAGGYEAWVETGLPTET